MLADPLLGARRDVHPQRIDDPVAGEGVDLEAELVGREDLLVLHVDRLDALVDPDDLLEERDARGEAGAGAPERLARPVFVEDALRLAEADDHRLLGLGHDREGAGDEDQQQDRDDRRARSGS